MSSSVTTKIAEMKEDTDQTELQMNILYIFVTLNTTRPDLIPLLNELMDLHTLL